MANLLDALDVGKAAGDAKVPAAAVETLWRPSFLLY
jgi:hypothetical protein